jgi:uncharacterized RDD family membrane protein YckC
MDSSNNYLLVINGKPEGPYTIEELKALKVKPTDFVRTDGMDDYKEAHDIPELREYLGFNKPAHILQYYGSFDQRLLASAIDWFILSGVFIFIMVVLLVIISDKTYQLVIIVSLLAAIPITKIIYHIIMESSSKQATIGKLILNIKVCDLQGERLSFVHSLGRNLAKILSVLTLFIGYLFAFFNKQQQCLHDMVAGTLVVKDRLI